jgi:hypothetical protein
MGYRRLTTAAFEMTRSSVAREGGSATHRGEQRHREGRGLDPLVDPKGFGVIRRSINRVEKKAGGFELLVGQAILKETMFDTTGSMGGNIELAFGALPRSYNLLHEVDGAPLSRYDLQIINAMFGDVSDNYVLCRSQAEMDEKIAEQLRLMVPEKDGGDIEEDPQYGLFGAAYLTAADIVRCGLKSYHFNVTDAPGRLTLDAKTLKRVFGDEVFDHVKENGHDIDAKQIPDTQQVVVDLLKKSHAFMIQVGRKSDATRFWRNIYGNDRIVIVPDVTYLPEVEAAIVGLTEGTIDLQGVIGFLRENAQMSQANAVMIREAVSSIPLRAQADLPNFAKVPLKGDIFAKKGDVWPIGQTDEVKPVKPAKSGGSGGKIKIWL